MLKRLDPCGIIRVQSWDIHKAPPAKVEESLGLLWPRETGTVACGSVDILYIGPTDWLVLASEPGAMMLVQTLKDAFVGSDYRATDVSAALSRIEVKGVHARALLAKGCSLDLRPQSFALHRCARTRLAGMPVVVCCTESSTFECIVSLSYGEYLLAWLSDATEEFTTRAS